MRDAFGDGLERMARLEELAQRRAAAHQNAGAFAPVRPSVADLVAEAVRRVVEAHPGTAVAATVDGPGGPVAVQVAWRDGEVVVVTPGPAPDGPGPAPDAAARLAELIRRDPSLLAPEPDR
jgi:hypothetical protein